jgi:hypothetical protein
MFITFFFTYHNTARLKIEQQINYKFVVKLTKTATSIFGLLCVVYGEEDRAASSTVTK